MTHDDVPDSMGSRPDLPMALGVPEAELTPPRIPPGAPVAVAIRSALEIGLRRIRINDPPARLGDVEGVHRLRTSVRRLRSVLRVFRGLVDPDWSEPIEAELKWLARWLGDVRDVDVMNDRLRQSAGELADALGPLFAALDRRHVRASEVLRSVLEGERYRSLLARLAEAAVHPALRDDARAPCRSALPPLVARTWKPLKARGRALGPHDPAEDFHAVRIRAKRARYAAETIADALDGRAADDARRFARLATRVQDVLGTHQDAIVAGQEILRVAAEHPADGPFNLAAGRLLERQELAARDARAKFFDLWDRLDRKKVRHWF